MLSIGGWLPETRKRLEQLIAENRNQGKRIVFDFDNTIICRDIGEASFAQLIIEEKLAWQNIPPELIPEHQEFDFNNPGENSEKLTNYYDSLQEIFAGDSIDNAPNIHSYAWVIQIMTGLTPLDVVHATETAFDNNSARFDMKGESYSRILGYGKPFFYPEMVELMFFLLDNNFECKILSASNIWTVRWMVLKHLNPQLLALGLSPDKLLTPADVHAASVLLRNPCTNQLYKESFLLRTDEDYSMMNEDRLNAMQLTSLPEFPFPAYTGKMACFLKNFFFERPFMAIGDSPSDLNILAFAEHRLWMTRIEKPAYQDQLNHFSTQTIPQGEWLLQPVATGKHPGFISSLDTTQPSRLND